MDDLAYWTEKLREAEQELEAARRLPDVNAAASKLQRAKARVRELRSRQSQQSGVPRIVDRAHAAGAS
jgi:hypothetical protein